MTHETWGQVSPKHTHEQTLHNHMGLINNVIHCSHLASSILGRILRLVRHVTLILSLLMVTIIIITHVRELADIVCNIILLDRELEWAY
jgi:hypothetical protein